jgi:uncharacterized lipoprotein YbaY
VDLSAPPDEATFPARAARGATALALVFALGCASSGPPPSIRLSGSVDYTEDMALPAGALVTVALHERRSPDGDDVEIARRVIETSDAPPIPFSMSLPPGGVDLDATYTIDAWISAGSRPWFVLEERVPVLTAGHPDDVELVLRRVP